MIASVLNISTDDILLTPPPSSTDSCCPKARNQDMPAEAMEEKLLMSTKSEKVKVLTFSSSSWSISKTSEYFDAPIFMVRKARNLKKTKGILGKSDKKLGRPISDELRNSIQAFYEKEIAKEIVTCNLKELYTVYVRVTDYKVSFSKFSQLRPKLCVTVNHLYGVHSVCVYKIHQNARVMIAGVPDTELLSLLVCDLSKRDCMLHNCDECPGVDTFREHLEDLFDRNGFDDHEIVSYKQWVKEEKFTNLISVQMIVAELIEKLCTAFDKLRPYHYVNQAQSAYLQELKANLKRNECIILLDFAENFSYIVQYSV